MPKSQDLPSCPEVTSLILPFTTVSKSSLLGLKKNRKNYYLAAKTPPIYPTCDLEIEIPKQIISSHPISSTKHLISYESFDLVLIFLYFNLYIN